MSFRLEFGDEERYFDMFTWDHFLKLARQYGWKPMGATYTPRCSTEDQQRAAEAPVLPDDWEWLEGEDLPTPKPERCGYQVNQYQFVEAEDARNLADALDRALADIPRESLMKDIIEEVTLTDGTVVKVIPASAEVTPIQFFSGPGREVIAQLVELLRGGGFTIC